MENLTKSQLEEFNNISNNQPVFAGNLLSHDTCRELREKGLVMFYDDGDDNKISGYVLTNKGAELKEKLEGAKMIASKSAVNKWCEK